MDTSEQDAETARLVTLTADVVSAYVSNNVL
jgi:predicted transcriptional regulator